MEIQFYKYHGAGNDFILIDNRMLRWQPKREQVALLCDRHFGIGADGLMLLNEQVGYDFGMIYYNSDGNESTMCGNGGRCIAAFARSLGLTDKLSRFSAVDGPHEAILLTESSEGWMVRLKMKDTSIGHVYPDGVFIDTGSPHFVVFTNDLKSIDVVQQGRRIRHDERFFPGGVNVDFVAIEEDRLFVRSYERGVEDETLSCGTGVTASAMVASYLRRVGTSSVEVTALGGKLTVSFRPDEMQFSEVWLEGPAKFVFSGKMTID